MVDVTLDPDFEKSFRKVKDNLMKEKIINQISKIRENPEVGKPMRYTRKGSRELYVSPYRLSYRIEDKIIYILDLYHKDEQ